MKKTKLNFFFLVAFSCLSFPAVAQVTALFTASTTSGCLPLTVNFTDHSSSNVTSWNWDFGNSNTATGLPASATYSTPGTYTVTLTVSNGASTDSYSLTITVYAFPVASFTLNNDTACVGSPVTFTSTSTPGSGTINHWRWTFGDGVVLDSTFNTTSHAYTFAQTFPVSLVVTDVHGCFSQVSGSLVINNGPVADFSASPLSSCSAPLTVTFTNATVGGASAYNWQFGDGGTSTQASPVHTYNTMGVYTVTLHATSPGCTSTMVKPGYVVVQNTVADFTGDTSVCYGNLAQFNDNSVPTSTSRNWNFGDGQSSGLQNPAHFYASSGTYNVTLIATANGCTDTVVKTIVVHPLPVVSFSADDSIGCSTPFNVNFTDHTIGGTSWLWNFGDGGTSTLHYPSHSYTGNGFFNVTLTVTDAFGCSATHFHNSYIYVNPPVADFISSPDSGCAPLDVSFTSTSSSSQPIASYTWDFGNGSSAVTTSSVLHTYSTPGIYTVSLVIVTQAGCSDSITYTNLVRVGMHPTANFTWNPDTICYGQTVSFTDQSVLADAWDWSFGDGGASTQQNPTYQYQDTGLFTVQLIVYNNGCSDTLVKPDIIRVLPPVPLFDFVLNCANPYSVSFIDQSKGADSLVWDFGDGTIDTMNHRNPVHVYATRGVKIVTQIAYNYTTGCSYAFTSGFQITDPIAFFSQQPVFNCYPLTVFFADTSQDANSRIWSFGDPSSGSLNSSSQSNPAHTFYQPGFYTVTLSITDIHGCANTLTKPNIIHAVGPLPGFIVNNTTGCTPLTVTFTDTSATNGGGIVHYNWDFGDGTSDTTSFTSISHVYTVPGLDTITLTVTDINGCTKSITRPGYIQPTFPFPAFTVPHYVCLNQPVLFNASASVTTAGSTYSWQFGDGGNFSSTSAFATHAYTADSNYVVRLTVTDFNGCDSTIADTVHAITPVANFGTNSIDFFCDNTQVSFADSSTGMINAWHWNFGDGGASYIQHPNYTYTIPGFYNVTLVATSIAGCSDTKTRDSIVVVPGTIGSFSFNPDSGCHPLTVSFAGVSSFYGVSASSLFYTWDFGDGNVGSQLHLDTIQHTYTQDGVYHPFLIIGFNLPNGQQCLDSTTAPGPVNVVTTLHVDIDSIQISLTEGDLIALNSTVTDSLGGPPFLYGWTPPQFVTCPTCPATTVYGDASAGSAYYTLKVTDNLGCEAHDSVFVIFIPCEAGMIIPSVFTPNNDGFNDTYFIEHFCMGAFHFTIYNRWGRIIYESSDPHFHWDGKTTGGADASDGTYYYVCKTAKHEYHGFLQLIRK